uniref:Secreted protein n=1 Tax=Knipowitschia caucasica TaxID=637954 RepID=A0AAV2LWS8_KNICA
MLLLSCLLIDCTIILTDTAEWKQVKVNRFITVTAKETQLSPLVRLLLSECAPCPGAGVTQTVSKLQPRDVTVDKRETTVPARCHVSPEYRVPPQKCAFCVCGAA